MPSLSKVGSEMLDGALPALDASSLTSIPAGNLTGTVADARISTLTSSKLSGALPAISGASLTNLDARDLENALPAISGASLTSLPSTADVYTGHYYTNPLNAPGTHSVTGVGFEPDSMFAMQIENRGQTGMSWGFATQSPSDN